MVKERIIYLNNNSSSWTQAWASPLFRGKIIFAIVFFIGVMLMLPHFFAIIETRNGIFLNDWLLQQVPAKDCSITIFIFLWSTSLLAVVRSIQQPALFLRMLYLLIVITLTRVVSISIFPLDPPLGLIHLRDPLTNFTTYGAKELFITKDLFFSGHTSNLFMFYLCLQKKRDKQFALLATIVVATLVLVQHIHYSIDVIAAFIFTYFLVQVSKRLSFFKI